MTNRNHIRICAVSWISACVLCIGLLSLSLLPARAGNIVPGRVLVRLQPNEDIESVDDDYGTTVEDAVSERQIYCLNVEAGQETAMAQQLSTDPRVMYAEADTTVALPEVSGQQFHFAFDASSDPGAYINQGAYQQIDFPGTASLANGAGVTVAILDTGATFTHPALSGHYLAGYNTIQPALPPQDLPDGITNEAVGHGTMMAGIVAYLAPQAKILPVRVLNGDGDGTMMDVVEGIHYAVTRGAQVINMSFGAAQSSKALQDALSEASDAGVLLVAAAGNDGTQSVQFPAACSGVLAVASVEADNTKSAYSDYGNTIAVVAPGSGIRSTYWTGGYANWSGTSFAAPFVTAEAVLVLSENPTQEAGGIVNQILASATSVDAKNPAYAGLLGAGIVDIQAALNQAASIP